MNLFDRIGTIANAPTLEPNLGETVGPDPALWGSPLHTVVCHCGWSHSAWSPTRTHSRKVAADHSRVAHWSANSSARFVEG